MSLILSCFLSSVVKTLVHRWTGRSGADDCRWEFSNKKCNLAQEIFLHLTTSTQIIIFTAVSFSSCLERASVSSCWHSMEPLGLMLSYYSKSGFPVLEKPVNRNGPVQCAISCTNNSRGPTGKIAMPHVCSKENNLIVLLDLHLIVNKNK